LKAFHFHLDRVLGWRHAELELEHLKIRQLTAELQQLDGALAELATARTAARQEVLIVGPLDGSDLTALATYLHHSNQTEQALLLRRQNQERRIDEQHGRLLEARRRLRVIEKFKARRFEEWRYELNRELESFASEAFLARWDAQKRRSPK
jgi:flagellar export protein FliJ